MKSLFVILLFALLLIPTETIGQKVFADPKGNIKVVDETLEGSIRTLQDEINMLVERRDDPATDIGDRLSLQAKIDDLAKQREAMFSGMIPSVEVVPKKEYDNLQQEIIRLKSVESEHISMVQGSEEDYQGGDE